MLVASDDLIQQTKREVATSNPSLDDLVEQPAQDIRGIEKPLVVWTLADD